MRESAIVTYGDHIIDYSIGTPTTVEFNFDRIWGTLKGYEDYYLNWLRFYHVHPEGVFNYSDKDLDCMKGLSIALGFPINFNIVTFTNQDPFYHDCIIRCYQYTKDGVKIVPEYSPGWNPLVFLKYLSYAGG